MKDASAEKHKKERRIMKISSFDGYPLEGKLTLPKGEDDVSKLVIFVHGTGPNTYENRDVYEGIDLNTFETFSDDFSKRGIAFLTYNQRGIHITDNPPLFYDMNVDEYKTYLPLNTVEDLHYMIGEIKKVERLKNSKIYLLGVSEGTIISPLFAKKYPDEVDALFLWGYANKNLKDTLIWQLSGESFICLFQECFEMDSSGRISKEAFDNGQKEMIVTGLGLGDNAFEVCDTNHDGYIDEDEIIALGKSLIGLNSDDFLTAAENRDDEWLLNNNMTKMTSRWLLQHASLCDNMELLPKLNLPISIFHGSLDMNCDVQGVYNTNERFQELGKTNLKINIFKGSDHSLNVAQYIIAGEMPEGIKAIFDSIDEMPLS